MVLITKARDAQHESSMGVCMSTLSRREPSTTLNAASFETHPIFTLESAKRVPAIVLKIYDGDTAWLAVNSPVRATFCVRLLGVDTHEMRQPAGPQRDERKRLAYAARSRLAQLSTNLDIDPACELKRKEWDTAVEANTLVIYAVFGAADKYGRTLATLFRSKDATESINGMMIREGHAVAYDGGTKMQ